MITLLTEIYRDHVHYSVQRADEVIWHRKEFFARDAGHRAGGFAFQTAAADQEKQARLAAESNEPLVEKIHNFSDCASLCATCRRSFDRQTPSDSICRNCMKAVGRAMAAKRQYKRTN